MHNGSLLVNTGKRPVPASPFPWSGSTRLELTRARRASRRSRLPAERPFRRLFAALGGFEEDRERRSRALPRAENGGIGEPGFTHDGHLRWSIWNCDALALRALRREVGRAGVAAARAEVAVAVEAADLGEQDRAGDCAFGGRLFCLIQLGTFLMFSLASDSVAVAPFQVSTPIEITTRIDATTATGRRDRRRSVRRSKNGSASSSTRQIVGIPTVPRMTESGHLKIRSR